MGRGPHWTTDEVATLVRLRAQNTEWPEVAAAIGRSVDCCRDKSARLNDDQRPRWSPEDEAELIRLRDVEHLSWGEIDGRLKRAHGSCAHKYNQLRKHQAPPPAKPEPAPKIAHPQWSEADMALAQDLWRQHFVNVSGESAPRHTRYHVFEIIGRALKRSSSAIENRLRLYGASFGLNPHSKPLAEATEVSQAMIEARARYAAWLRQDPVAQMLGDPPPGYSALDQTRREPEARRIVNNRIEPAVTLPTRVDL